MRGSGLCRGCFRTLQEIADWLEMTAEEKRATLERAAERARCARVSYHLHLAHAPRRCCFTMDPKCR